MTTPPDSPRTGATITVASTAASLALIPAFLLGATAPFVRSDLGFGAGVLGLAVSTYWTAMALAGAPCGRLVQRHGGVLGLRIGTSLACVALLLVATAGSAVVLFVGIGLAGVASAVITPSTDVVVISRVPAHRLGLAFGIKQSSLPAASLLAGIGVPTLAVTVGWRWAFVAATVLALPALALVRASWGRPSGRSADGAPAVSGPRPAGAVALTGLPALVVGMGLAMAAVSATGAFYVESALGQGIEVGTAGVLLAAGSAVGILGRFVFTLALSSHADPFAISAALTAAGAVGVVGILLAESTWPLLLATVLAFGAGWGWNGLFTHAVVASHRESAARASSMLVVASATGGVLGPAVFGLVATTAGIGFAWALAAGELVSASVLWLVSTRDRAGSVGSRVR